MKITNIENFMKDVREQERLKQVLKEMEFHQKHGYPGRIIKNLATIELVESLVGNCKKLRYDLARLKDSSTKNFTYKREIVEEIIRRIDELKQTAQALMESK